MTHSTPPEESKDTEGDSLSAKFQGCLQLEHSDCTSAAGAVANYDEDANVAEESKADMCGCGAPEREPEISDHGLSSQQSNQAVNVLPYVYPPGIRQSVELQMVTISQDPKWVLN